METTETKIESLPIGNILEPVRKRCSRCNGFKFMIRRLWINEPCFVSEHDEYQYNDAFDLHVKCSKCHGCGYTQHYRKEVLDFAKWVHEKHKPTGE